MHGIFISHSSDDQPRADEMAAWLRAREFQEIFLSSDPKQGIAAGRNWEQELYRQLERCRALIVLCSEQSMRSDWCFSEITYGRANGKALFPVKIESCDLRPPLDQLQGVDLTVDREEGYRRLWDGLVRAGLDPQEQFHRDPGRPPYPGLMAFQEQDAAVFFGRDDEIRRGLDILGNFRVFGGSRLLLVHGASGSGKSSLVRAGLVPRLKRDPEAWVVLGPMRTRGRPFEELAAALGDAFANHEGDRERKRIADTLRQAADQEPANGRILVDLFDELASETGGPESVVVLVLDQLEELLNPELSAENTAFLTLLRAALEEERGPHLVMATIRSDFLGALQNHSALRGLGFQDFTVGTLTLEGYAKVIEGPARVAGLTLEPGLRERMVKDTETEDALPLLAFTLRELWERFGRDGGELSLEDYSARLGGLAGSVQRAADAVIKAHPLSDDQRADLARSLVAMTRINEEGRYARRQVHWADLQEQSHPVLERFVAARLLVSGREQGTIEVAHEALLRNWSLLKGWLDDSREFLLWRRRLQAAVDEYAHSKSLLHGAALQEAEKWLQRRGTELHPQGRQLIERSIALREREESAARRRRRTVIGGLTVGLLVAVILASIATWQSGEAERQRDAARQAEASAMQNEAKAVTAAEEAEKQRRVALAGLSRYLAAESGDVLDERPQRGLLLAVEAVRATRDVDGSVTTVAENTLHRALASAGGMPLSLRLGGDEGAGFSADNRWLIIEGRHEVRYWDLHDLSLPPRSLELYPTSERWVEFSPGGTWIAIAGGEPVQIKLYRLDGDGAGSAMELRGHPVRFDNLVISPDDQWVMVAGSDARVWLWRLSKPDADPLLLVGHSLVEGYDGEMQGIREAAFSPDGRWLVTNGYDDTTRLLDLRKPTAEPRTLLTQSKIWAPPHFSRDGRWLAQTIYAEEEKSWDERLAVWSLDGGDVKRVPLGDGTVSTTSSFDDLVVGFHPTEDELLVVAKQTLYRWQLSTFMSSNVTPQPGYLGAYSPDGNWLATVSVEEGEGPRHQIRLHDRTGDERLVAHESEIERLAFSPDNRSLVAVGKDGRMTLSHFWPNRSRTDELSGHDGRVGSVEFSRDGRWLLSTPARHWDGHARLWRVGNPDNDPVVVHGTLREPELKYTSRTGGGGGAPKGGLPDALAFDGEGRWAAMAGERGTALLVALDDPNAEPTVFGAPQRRPVTAVAFTSGGDRLAMADWDHRVRLWDPAEPKAPPLEFPGLKGEAASSVSAMAVSGDGRWIATGDRSGRVVLRDTARPEGDSRVLVAHRGWVMGIRFSADGKLLVSAGQDGIARVWTVDDPQAEPVSLEGHKGGIRLGMSPDGRWIITAGEDALVRLWRTDRLDAEPMVLRGHGNSIVSQIVSEDSRWLATSGEDGAVRLWSLQEPDREPALLRAPAPMANVLAFDPEARLLAAGGLFGSVKVWSMDDLSRPPVEMPIWYSDPLSRKRNMVWALGFSPDGEWLTTLTDGTAHLWRVRTDRQIDLACRTAGRNLTLSEWERFIEGLPYRLTCPYWGPDPDLLHRAGKWADSGEVERATALFEYARVLLPDAKIEPRREAVRLAVEGRLGMGRKLARKGRTDAALAELQRIRRIDPASTLDPEKEVERVITAQAKVEEGSRRARLGELAEAGTLFAEALVLDPGLELDPEAESRRLYAPHLEREGLGLARSGRMEEAIAKLADALEHDPGLKFDPQRKARSVRGTALEREGRRLAENGELDAAIEKYRQALAIDPGLDLDPVAEATRRMAPFHVEEGRRKLAKRDFPGAMESLDRALAVDPEFQIFGIPWNQLCWDGSREGHAREVKAACERAVAQRPDDGGYRDSRGVARALSGDIDGAIDDFSVFVSWASSNSRRPVEIIEQRKRWIEALQRGERPVDFQQLEALGRP